MVCVTGIMYALGYTLAGWLGYACFFMKADNPAAQFSWRFPLAFQVVFPLVLLAGSNMIPFSPRWLLSQGRRQEALDIVKRLHRTPADPEDVTARREFWLMEKQFEMDRSLSRGHFELFRTPANRKRALMAFILMWGTQFLGIFVMTNYVSKLHPPIGLKEITRLSIGQKKLIFLSDEIIGCIDIRQPRTQRFHASPAQRVLDDLYDHWQHLDGAVH